MPIGTKIAIAGVLVVAFAAAAPAAVVIGSFQDLHNERKVRMLDAQFSQAVAASVIYERCGDTFPISPAQLAYVKQLFLTVGEQYTQSYYDTYLEKTGAPPPQKITDYYVRYIADEQASTLRDTNSYIDARSCRTRTLEQTYKAIETRRLYDESTHKKPTDPWSQ